MGEITRRDFINGTLVAAGSSTIPREAKAQEALAALESSPYPPGLTGLRGSHPGSNEHAHDLAWGRGSDWGVASDLEEAYDLVVIGGGISGLAAAYFFQQKHGRGTKVLVLDNHDDFGGHAKRNEHKIGGRLHIGYGGSQTLVEPGNAGEVVLELLRDIGMDVERFETAYDAGFYRRHDLSAVTYFNEEVFGVGRVVQHPYCNYPNFIEGLPQAKLSNEEAARQAPLGEAGREQLLRALKGGLHLLDLPAEELQHYVGTHSYYDYLRDTLGVDDPGVLRMARCSGLDWASTGTDLMTIGAAKAAGALGFAPVAVLNEDHPYIHHFPDGNAGLARALVKRLVPRVGEGSNAEELVLSRFDYDELDKPHNSVRIRLESTAVDVRHAGDPKRASDVLVSYVNGDRLYRVRGKGVVMACYNLMIPHIVADLPEEQAAALRQQQKSPLQYTTVGLRNWLAIREIGMGMAMCPGNMHQGVFMDFPVSLGGYEFTKTPDDPCVLMMIHCPYGETPGAPRLEQFREARYRMLRLEFDDYEAEIRRHLTGMLPQSSFDFDRDVESITVNRWAHGYTIAGPGDSVERGRQPFGRITVANCDSAAEADAKAAIRMGWRAVNELG
ncbi:MAG: FAD-dependent oxidoreductase [Acidobacteriota bacterium]|nr:FAD-dependent oxidoreductase [Acidobacteriota bacterium]